MGGGFGGAFLLGLSNSMQRAQEQRVQEDYKKSLIEQSKLHTKLLENQIAQADAKQGMMDMFLRANGIEPPPRPAQQPMQLPQTQQPQTGLIPALGRMFGFGNAAQSQQQPATGTPPPQPLPQTIAQGQMQAQMPGQVQPNRALLNDIMKKQLFDLPGWEERFAAESKQIGRAVTTMGPNGPMTVLLDKMGRPMGSMPTVPEYGSIKAQGAMGEEYEQFYNKAYPPGVGGQGGGAIPGAGGQGVMTKFPPQMVPQGMPDTVKQKVTDLEIFKNQMQSLKDMGQNPKVFGLWANAAAKIADSPVGALMPADPDVLAFHKAVKNIENIKVHQFGGSNLTSTELARALASLPRTYNQQNFQTAVDQTIKAADADIKDYYKAYAQPEAMKGVQGGLGPRPQVGIPQGYQYGGTKDGKPFYVNPNASPEKRYWVP